MHHYRLANLTLASTISILLLLWNARPTRLSGVRDDWPLLRLRIVSEKLNTAVLELRSGLFREHTQVRVAALWISANLYASRLGRNVLAVNEGLNLPATSDLDRDHVARQIELARRMKSAWPGNQFPSLGDEIESALSTSAGAIVELITSNGSLGSSPLNLEYVDGGRPRWATAPVAALYRQVGIERRLTASAVRVITRSDQLVHCGFSLQLIETKLTSKSEHYEQLLLHELLAATDLYSRLYGERLVA
jgi:hypothetical protein